jgi:hypothetical protein
MLGRKDALIQKRAGSIGIAQPISGAFIWRRMVSKKM